MTIMRLIGQRDTTASQRFSEGVPSSLNIADFSILLDVFTHALIIFMKYRHTLQESIELVKVIRSVSDMAAHFQLCSQQLKGFKTYDRTRNYHLHSTQEIVTASYQSVQHSPF
jgi:hypothetical protein